MTDPQPIPTSSGRHSVRRKLSFNQACQRLRSRNAAHQAAAAVAAAVAKAADTETQTWEWPSGVYLQQVMPGWRLGKDRCRLVCWLITLAFINGGLACVGCLNLVNTTEIELEYTGCTNSTPAVCRLPLRVKSNLTGPLYLYYGLDNAYFNHRRIQMSWSLRQMLGLAVPKLGQACLDHTERGGLPVLPCGALPNAIFNDTVDMLGPMSGDEDTATGPNVSLSGEGINWPSHLRGLYLPLAPELLAGTARPDSWPQPATHRYKRPFADAEDLQTWVVTPAFPRFRKLSRLVMANLSSGTYRLVIGYNYPVKVFSGTKRFIVAQKSWLGGKNLWLALLPAVTSASYILLCFSALLECGCRRERVT